MNWPEIAAERGSWKTEGETLGTTKTVTISPDAKRRRNRLWYAFV